MSHGSSPASWTAVLLALLGTTIGGIGMVPEPNWIVFSIGVAIALIAGPVGLIMSKSGRGAKSH